MAAKNDNSSGQIRRAITTIEALRTETRGTTLLADAVRIQVAVSLVTVNRTRKTLLIATAVLGMTIGLTALTALTTLVDLAEASWLG